MIEADIQIAERRMRLDLEQIRGRFANSTNKGASAEESVRQFLQQYLPARLHVTDGEIIDSYGARSRQTDVVILTDDHPRFTQPGSFFVEGVCGAGEVKIQLTSNELADALVKARASKVLRVVQGVGTLGRGNGSDFARFFISPPYFTLAFESALSLQTILSKMAEDRQSSASPGLSTLDAVFVLGQGCVIDCGDGKGQFRFVHEGKSIPGLILRQTDAVLFQLLHWLTAVMPRTIRWDSILLPYLQRTATQPPSSERLVDTQ
jgi:hypothetical protein